MTKTKTTLLSFLLFSGLACGGGSATKAESTAVAAQPDVSAPAEVQLPTAEEILTRSIEVTGGQAAYEAITSFAVVGSFSIPAQKIEGGLKLSGKPGGKMVLELEIPGIGTERSGSDGTTVWSMSAMTGSRVLEGAERDTMLRDADLLKELNWRKYYKSATTTGMGEVDGKPAYIVEMVDMHDTKETRYYDKESGFLVRQSGIVKNQMGEMKSNTLLKQYETFGDFLMPRVIEVQVMGMKQIMTTKTIEFNTALADDLFALPEDIKKLVDAEK